VRDEKRLHALSIDLEVPFHDVDGLQVVWHGHYLKYFELARTALMRSRHLDVQDLTALGYRQLVVETQCRHTFPCATASASAWRPGSATSTTASAWPTS